jgi:hypothetical protein
MVGRWCGKLDQGCPDDFQLIARLDLEGFVYHALTVGGAEASQGSLRETRWNSDP